MGRDEMAALVHLSPTRFSHWFVEQTGLPLRSYAKWLHLTQALQHLAKGVRLIEAAHEGDDREFGKNRTLSFASSCNQFIVFSMDERKWRKLFDKQIGIL